MSLVQSARLRGHDPWVYLKDVLTRLPAQGTRHRRIAASPLGTPWQDDCLQPVTRLASGGELWDGASKLRLPPDETRHQQDQLRNVERLGKMRLIAREQ
jgi:hypothetical protein